MIATEKLETILTKCNIIKQFATLPDTIHGFYYCDGSYYIILINEIIKNYERLYRCVIAEEIGHYRMTIGDITPRKYMCYRKRLTIDKQEMLALHWATDFLIPSKMIIDVMKNKIANTIFELEDYFSVTQEFLIKKFEFMAKENLIWKIDDQRHLYLHNLPSIYIFDKFNN